MPMNEYNNDIEKHLEAPMPWIGIYVASASLICTVLISADLFVGLRRKKLWFPSKLFSLNATSLTLLAVSMKLPVDLTTRMWAATDRLAKISSMFFLSTAMGNFIICLGSMDDKEILVNVTALGIFVITVLVNVGVQIIQMRVFLKGRIMLAEEVLASISMLVLLVMTLSTAVMVPTIKKYLESKYREMLKISSNEQALESMEEGFDSSSSSVQKLRLMIQKYCVMAETSRPQFAIARSSTCTASGIVCIFAAVVLMQAEVRMILEYRRIDVTASKYGWSVKWIVLAHTIAVLVGTIAPAFRFFTAIKLKIDERGYASFRDELRVEAYWKQRLVDWKESSLLPLQIRERKWKKMLHGAKWLVLDFLIRVQICVVLMSKVISFASLCLSKPLLISFRLMTRRSSSSSLVHDISSEPERRENELDLTPRRYVLLLEGEAELPRKVRESICAEVDELIEKGKKRKPKNLINLLHKIGNFRGLREVNQNQVPSLHSKEPPNCWSLPLVTLTSIAVALPNISKDKICSLLTSMGEGMFYVKLIEKTLDKKGKLAGSRNAADVMWVGVELYRKWQDSDLHEASLRGKSSEETLRELCSKAEKTILEFKREEVKDFVMENPLNWPVSAVAANSMYRISQRLLVAGDYLQRDERLFEQLCNMIANIFGACLTNLMQVIIIKCHHKDIKVKAKSVHQAALLLGETEEILEILQQQRANLSDPCETEFIDKWCNLFKKKL